MSNFGFADLRVVQPYEPSFREARSAVGASEILKQAREYKTVAEAVGDCTLVVGTTSADRRQLQQELKALGEAAKMIRRQAEKGRVALLFGSEKRGLSNEDFSQCHWLSRIPTRAEHGSMNLGQAVAVCLYEMARSPGKRPESALVEAKAERQASPANHAVLEAMTSSLLEASQISGWKKSSTSAEKIRQMVMRQGLSEADGELWLGMLRQILWKLKHD